jgi:hypothetical protein
MAQYVVGLDSSLKRLFVWKTTGDPTTLTNWSAQDTGITYNSEIKSIWAVLDGTDIHVSAQIAVAFDGTSGKGYLAYSVFDTTTDTWSILREEVDDGYNNNIPGHLACSIGLRSDGDVIILYTATSTANGSVNYARRESGVWTNNQIVRTVGTAGVLVMGASDRAHFFYTEGSQTDLYHRALNSANALQTEADVDASVSGSIFHHTGRGISYVDNGNTVVKAPYIASDESITGIRFNSADVPTIATDTAASDNDAEDINSSVVACMAVDGTDTWLLYSGGGVSGVDQDLYTDMQSDGGSWGTDTEEQDAITMNRLSAGKYTRSATDYIGYVWLDGTTTSYDEITLAAPPAPIPDRLVMVNQAVNRASTY